VLFLLCQEIHTLITTLVTPQTHLARTLIHQRGRNNRLIRLSLSTASVFVSRLSGSKSQQCDSRSSKVSLLLSDITQDATRFYYISEFDIKYAAKVDDVITNPLPAGRNEN